MELKWCFNILSSTLLWEGGAVKSWRNVHLARRPLFTSGGEARRAWHGARDHRSLNGQKEVIYHRWDDYGTVKQRLRKNLQLYQFPKSYSPHHTACIPYKIKSSKGKKKKKSEKSSVGASAKYLLNCNSIYNPQLFLCCCDLRKQELSMIN